MRVAIDLTEAGIFYHKIVHNNKYIVPTKRSICYFQFNLLQCDLMHDLHTEQ